MAIEPLGRTVGETAQVLRCTSHQVLRHIRDGRLRAINTAGQGRRRPRWLIREKDLNEFLDAQLSTSVESK